MKTGENVALHPTCNCIQLATVVNLQVSSAHRPNQVVSPVNLQTNLFLDDLLGFWTISGQHLILFVNPINFGAVRRVLGRFVGFLDDFLDFWLIYRVFGRFLGFLKDLWGAKF